MPKDTRPWIRCADQLPPFDLVVTTKIDDERGARNEAKLKRITNGGHLWFTADGGMYVYYEPTHWLDTQ